MTALFIISVILFFILFLRIGRNDRPSQVVFGVKLDKSEPFLLKNGFLGMI